jgi:acyl carrier protein
MSLNSFEREVAGLIVSTLNLESSADEIIAEEPLFGDGGLGLDSIDALELALAIDRNYGIKISAEDDDNETHFASLRALAQFITDNRKS